MKKHSILIICLALIAIAAVASIALYDDSHHGEEKHFDAKETIFDHLVDHYSWKVPYSHSHKISLPVIVKEKEGGWHMFMSDKIEKGKTYEGFYIDTDQYKGKIVGTAADGSIYRPIDLSITKNVLALFITALVVCLCIFPLVNWYKKHGNKAPRGFLGALD